MYINYWKNSHAWDKLEQYEKAKPCYRISPNNSDYRRNLFECELAISNKKVEQKVKDKNIKKSKLIELLHKRLFKSNQE